MKPGATLLMSVLLALAGTVAGAAIREISQSDLRRIVSAGEAIGLRSVVASVAAATGAEPIEARAFELDGVYYRIVLKRSDGSLVSVIIDAATGQQVKSASPVGRQVSGAAGKSAEKSTKGKSATAGANGNGNGNGNGGGNGNSGGNSGGNGGGNSGGNGGGNSGGNGGGNSGGNGNGGGKP